MKHATPHNETGTFTGKIIAEMPKQRRGLLYYILTRKTTFSLPS
jgi:hypothetical protein